jgi:hypothetical protein
MTTVCQKIPLGAKNPIDFKMFFDQEQEAPIIHDYEYRQLPPPASPATSCDFNLFFGFFFDGTRNNYNQCTENEAYSNVARLYDCYPGQGVPEVIKHDPPWNNDYRHFFKVYVPGVGSPFPEVFDEGKSMWGAAAGAAGHERLAWALMQAVNNIHRYFLRGMLYSAAEIRDISRKLVLTGWNLNISTEKALQDADAQGVEDPRQRMAHCLLAIDALT